MFQLLRDIPEKEDWYMQELLFVCTLIGGIAGTIQILETLIRLCKFVQRNNTKKK
ncbi:MAG: hypothetical protein IJB15_12695 [Clostridia bacterium]|nr:hypothetical protein [Clostridia bacterium]MBQ4607561.1 hypothetical protein [Clostridia bacterium]